MKLEHEKQPDFLQDMERGAMTEAKILATAKNLKEPGEKSNIPSLRRAYEHLGLTFDDPKFPISTFWDREILGPRAKKKEAREAKLNGKGGGNGSHSPNDDGSHLPLVENHPKAKQIQQMKKRRDVYDND